MRFALAAAMLLLAPAPGVAHRLDEYLQATLVSVGKDRLQAEITLTPGVAVFPMVAAQIDTDADGAISEAEQRAYVGRLVRDLSFTIDGHPLALRLLSMRFPSLDRMQQGLGAIRFEFEAVLPRGGGRRRLVFENRHQTAVGAYLVNCLVPSDPEIRILAQNRNYTQSLYQLDYAMTGVPPEARFPGLWSSGGLWFDRIGFDRVWLVAVAVLLFARFAFWWRRSGGSAGHPLLAHQSREGCQQYPERHQAGRR